MPDQVQLRGGGQADNDAFTGANREVTVDTTNKTLRVHDGTTSGGSKLAAYDEWGRLQVADPVDDSDVANKGWVNGVIGGAGLLGTENLLHVRDEKSQNTHGGTFTSGARRTRDLNTVKLNTIAGASLASNQVTLPLGSYWANGSAPALRVNAHQAWLRNTTENTDLIAGTVEQSVADAYYAATKSLLCGFFTLAAESVIEVQHECGTSASTAGFGHRANFDVEVYTELLIWKVDA